MQLRCANDNITSSSLSRSLAVRLCRLSSNRRVLHRAKNEKDDGAEAAQDPRERPKNLDGKL